MLAILQPSAPSPPWPLASQGESRQLMPSDSSLARSTGNTQRQDCYLMAPDYSGHSRPLVGYGSAGRAGLSNHFKISLKIKNALGGMRFWFPPAVVQGLRRVVRWALLILASRFASPPYLAPGSGLCEASPAALPFAPSGRVRREYTTAAFY